MRAEAIEEAAFDDAAVKGGVGESLASAQGPKVKKRRKQLPAPRPEDLEPGTPVTYWDGYLGSIREAFVPLDEFWLTDDESGDVVKDEEGNIVAFKSAELRLVAPPPAAPPRPASDGHGPRGGVVVLGTEEHVFAALKHFGEPSMSHREAAQQIFAVPCADCSPQCLRGYLDQEMQPEMREFAKKLRPDITVTLRTYHMERTVEDLGGDLLKLEGYYLFSTVQLPYGQNEIDKSVPGSWERDWREFTCSQIDLCITAADSFPEASRVPGTLETDTPSVGAAKRALGEQLGIRVDNAIWAKAFQKQMRQELGVANLPLSYKDGHGTDVKVVVLPRKAGAEVEGKVLVFGEYLAEGKDEDAEEAPADRAPACPLPIAAASLAAPPAARAAAGAAKLGGKTASEWKKEQVLFGNLPPLPPGWIRVRSKKGEVYYFNMRTEESSFDVPGMPVQEAPMPEGWTKQASKSSGKSYYFNAKTNKSQYDRPKV